MPSPSPATGSQQLHPSLDPGPLHTTQSPFLIVQDIQAGEARRTASDGAQYPLCVAPAHFTQKALADQTDILSRCESTGEGGGGLNKKHTSFKRFEVSLLEA